MFLQILTACGLIVACAVLNRVRGDKLGWIPFLPGRAIMWVAPAVGITAWAVHPWPVAVAFGLGYLVWGIPGWGKTLMALSGQTLDRAGDAVDSFLDSLPGSLPGVFLRMLFVLPAVAAVSWLIGDWRFMWAAPAFAAAATTAYTLLFRPLGPFDWPRAEYATGAIWGALILSAAAL